MITLANIHRVVFASTYERNFSNQEVIEKASCKKESPKYSLLTLQRLIDFLPSDVIFKHHPSGGYFDQYAMVQIIRGPHNQ